MEIYYVFAIVDRSRTAQLQALCDELQLSVALSKPARGTATSEQLSLHDLRPTEKTVVSTVATGPSMRRLLRAAKRNMFIDIPGNGIMAAVPMKSISGKKSLAYCTDGQDMEGVKPDMEFKYELIVVILNEGCGDAVMDAARSAGATGGTIFHAKGTGQQRAQPFFGVSLAEEKDMIYILASTGKKSGIMRAISSQCGPGTQAGAICFSLPVSEVAGIRRLDDGE